MAPAVFVYSPSSVATLNHNAAPATNSRRPEILGGMCMMAL
jgi:hypothetical protein